SGKRSSRWSDRFSPGGASASICAPRRLRPESRAAGCALREAERMKIIGLTGGTGSGKSTAARRFEERGIPVIDADRIGHELIAPGGAAEQAVIAAFGEDILESGTIDRAKLG